MEEPELFPIGQLFQAWSRRYNIGRWKSASERPGIRRTIRLRDDFRLQTIPVEAGPMIQTLFNNISN